MLHPIRKLSASVSRSTGSWLTLLLLFVVLVPSLGLLWFHNRTVENEQLAVRQRLVDAYRAQLTGLRDRLENNWVTQAKALDAQLDTTTSGQLFASIVHMGIADAVVCFDAQGNLRYPEALRSPNSDSVSEFRRASGAWAAAQDLEPTDPAAAARAYATIAAESPDADVAARALQAQARSLVRAGETSAAVALLTAVLQQDRFASAQDAQGRLLAPRADLLALELVRDTQPDLARTIRERLHTRVTNYDTVTMPASQRRFLLRELQRIEPNVSVASLLAAEDLAAAYVQAVKNSAREPALRRSALPDVWQQTSLDGRIVLLHRQEKLSARLQALVEPTGLPDDVQLEFVEPGHESESALLSLPSERSFPGWRLALTVADPVLFEATNSRRVASYAWIVGLVVFTALVLAALAAGLVRRQIALTQLRNDLVANVTHELKTPLASMRLLVETLLNTPQFNEQTTREYLQLIATENLRLSRLIGNFLTFSRIERNKYTFDFKDVPAAGIVDATVAAVRDRMQTPGCVFNVEIAPALPRVRADVDAVVTVLVNLLDNAWKYSGDTKQIRLSASARNGSVIFAVRDNGIGLSPRDTKRIFRRFEQVRPSQPNGGGGVGLGLSIVRFIVHAHDGTVGVESAPGRGSTFTITLPATHKTRA